MIEIFFYSYWCHIRTLFLSVSPLLTNLLVDAHTSLQVAHYTYFPILHIIPLINKKVQRAKKCSNVPTKTAEKKVKLVYVKSESSGHS